MCVCVCFAEKLLYELDIMKNGKILIDIKLLMFTSRFHWENCISLYNSTDCKEICKDLHYFITYLLLTFT